MRQFFDFSALSYADGLRPAFIVSKSVVMVATVFVFAGIACTDVDDPDPVESSDAGTDVTDETDDADDGDAEDEDTETDDADTSTLCEPGELRCLDPSTVQECEDDGSEFVEFETCEDGEICEDGACIDEPVCEPGEEQCDDGTTVLTCTQTGQWGPPEDCEEDEACFDGSCVQGSPTGTECDEADDCAGGLCRCGTDESCDLDHPPYCTSDCEGSSCNPGEICWHSAGVDSAGYDHCLAPCGSDCGFDQCHSVLSEDDGGNLVWKDACLPDEFKEIGEQCDSDAECVSEQCNEELFDFGMCTRDCEVGGCPDGTACAEADGGSGDYLCLEECDEDDDCPEGFGVDCRSRSSVDGQLVDVCLEG